MQLQFTFIHEKRSTIKHGNEGCTQAKDSLCTNNLHIYTEK
jgi:hypothetical protein